MYVDNKIHLCIILPLYTIFIFIISSNLPCFLYYNNIGYEKCKEDNNGFKEYFKTIPLINNFKKSTEKLESLFIISL